METEAEKQEEEERARQYLKNARAQNWPSVEKFEGTRLLIDDDYQRPCLKAETVVGGQKRVREFEAVPSGEVNPARAEMMVLEAVEWVSEQHRA